ncbi:MAG TPA: universal stress protein, partial [Pirellulaceae bacterium]|nr:universal stress protein [Pirellulaceae bacterium]
MLRTVLVGLNGSGFSAAATECALSLAKQHAAGVLGLGVVDVPRLTRPQPVPLGGGAFKDERDAAALKAEREKIAGILASLETQAQAAGVACRTIALEGTPVELLIRESQRADLLVVGKKHVPHEEWEQSSRTLERLLHQTVRPVLCVPVGGADLTRVLVAYDGSAQSAKALQLFVASGLAAPREI